MSEFERNQHGSRQSRPRNERGARSSSSSKSGYSSGTGKSRSGHSSSVRSSSRSTGSARNSSRNTYRGRSSGYRKSSYNRRKSPYSKRNSGVSPWFAVVFLVFLVSSIAVFVAVKGKRGSESEEESISTEETTTIPEIKLTKEVKIDNISITGMSRDVAKAAVLREYPWMMQVTNGDESYALSNLIEPKIDALLDEVYSEDEKQFYQLDLSGLDEAITEQAAAIAQKWDKKAKNGSISSFDKDANRFVFSKGESGVAVNQEKLIADITKALESKDFDAVIPVSTTSIPPEFDEAAAKEKYKTISTFTTNSTANSKRNTNLKLACQAINGKVLQPGEEFSFNNVVGQRTEEKGYQAAAAYSNGEVVQEIGGGVCQVSTTLYNAVLRAGLKTTTRRAHTYEPSYVTPGMDATVSYGGPDYKFVNNSSTAIGIRASYENQVVTVSIYAVPILEEGVKYSLKSTKIKDIDLSAPTYEEDQTLQPGEEKVKSKGTQGSYWETKLIVTKDGKTISEEVDHNTTYKGHAPVIARNTSGVVISANQTTAATEPVIASEGAADGITSTTKAESSPSSQSHESSSNQSHESSSSETKPTVSSAAQSSQASSTTPVSPTTTAAPTTSAAQTTSSAALPATTVPVSSSPAVSEPDSSLPVQGPGHSEPINPGPAPAAPEDNIVAPNPLGLQ